MYCSYSDNEAMFTTQHSTRCEGQGQGHVDNEAVFTTQHGTS